MILGNATMLFADYECPPPQPVQPMNNCGECVTECQICHHECKCACPNKCAQLNRHRGPRREITPNAGPCVANGVDVFFTADFIYWTIREDGLEFAATTGFASSSTNTSTSQGKIFHPEFKFEPGFKAGLGLDFDHDGWDLYAQYTWLRAKHDHEHVHPSPTTLLIDFFILVNGAFTGGVGSTATWTSASAKWHEDFNVVDLELGRNFYISRYLMLRPHFGLKGTWQTQKFDVSFDGTISTQSTTISSTNHENIWGIGIRAGLDTAWHFTRSFSLYGDIAVTGLWEQFEIKRSDLLFNNVTRTGTVGFHAKNNFHTIEPIFEWEIGLRWETWWCDDDYHFSIEAGWEEQTWLGQNQFISTGSNGDNLLSLQGLTTGIRFDF